MLYLFRFNLLVIYDYWVKIPGIITHLISRKMCNVFNTLLLALCVVDLLVILSNLPLALSVYSKLKLLRWGIDNNFLSEGMKRNEKRVSSTKTNFTFHQPSKKLYSLYFRDLETALSPNSPFPYNLTFCLGLGLWAVSKSLK